jgi:hypothetical protein
MYVCTSKLQFKLLSTWYLGTCTMPLEARVSVIKMTGLGLNYGKAHVMVSPHLVLIPNNSSSSSRDSECKEREGEYKGSM